MSTVTATPHSPSKEPHDRSQISCQHHVRIALLGAIDLLPPLTQWPEDWLSPKSPPDKILRAWVAQLGVEREGLGELISQLDAGAARALVCDILRQSALALMHPEERFPLVGQLIHEFVMHHSEWDERWAQDEQTLKAWLRDRAVVLATQTPIEGSERERALETRVEMTRVGWDDFDEDEVDLEIGAEQLDLFRARELLAEDAPERSIAPKELEDNLLPPRPSAPLSIPVRRLRQESPPGGVPTQSEGSALTGLLEDDVIGRAVSAPPLSSEGAPPSPAPAAPPSPAPMSPSPSHRVPSTPPKLTPYPSPAPLLFDDDFSHPDAEPPEFFELTAPPAPEMTSSERETTGAPQPIPLAEPMVRADEDEIPMPQQVAAKGSMRSQSVARRLIDHDMVRPGPLERLFERIAWLSYLFYKTLGFSTLMLLHIVDNLWEFVSGYISRVFKGLMNIRSAARIAARRADGTLIEGVKRDIVMMMGVTEQLLCLPTTRDHITPDHHQLAEDVLVSVKRGTPLALALSARARLDDLRRDLNFVRGGGTGRRLWRAIFKWVIGLIPNPFELIKPWFNALLLSLKVSYSRAQVQESHQQLITALSRLIDELERVKNSREYDPRATEILVTELQGYLDEFLTLCLQSRYQAQPWRWSLLDRLSALHTLGGHQAEHPLSALEARQALLKVCADVENIPLIGARLNIPEGESYQTELKQTQTLLKRLRKLRERGLL